MCILFVILGILIIIAGITVQVAWFGITFGTVIIGILLLVLAPDILLFPFVFSFQIGSILMQSCNSRRNREEQMDYDALVYSKAQSIENLGNNSQCEDYTASTTNSSLLKVKTSLPRRKHSASTKNIQERRVMDNSMTDVFSYDDINLNINTEAQIYDSEGNPLIMDKNSIEEEHIR